MNSLIAFTMSEASDQVLHPTNPTLAKDLNTPKERGDIRFLADGSLLYREPITDTEGKKPSSHQPRKKKQAQQNRSASSPARGHSTWTS